MLKNHILEILKYYFKKKIKFISELIIPIANIDAPNNIIIKPIIIQDEEFVLSANNPIKTQTKGLKYNCKDPTSEALISSKNITSEA